MIFNCYISNNASMQETKEFQRQGIQEKWGKTIYVCINNSPKPQCSLARSLTQPTTSVNTNAQGKTR